VNNIKINPYLFVSISTKSFNYAYFLSECGTKINRK